LQTRIAVSTAAFEAIAASLPFGSVSSEREVTATGEPMRLDSLGIASIAVDKVVAEREGRTISPADQQFIFAMLSLLAG
jgi:hypothetical protein